MNGPEYTYNRRIESHGRQIGWIGLATLALVVAVFCAGAELRKLTARIANLEAKEKP